MKSFLVQTSNSTKSMNFSQISKLMTNSDLAELLISLETSYGVKVKLADGTEAVIRQEELLSPKPTNTRPEIPVYKVDIVSSVPVSARVFVFAENETEAAKAVERMITNETLDFHKLPNFREEMRESLDHWLQQTDSDDWEIGDVELSLQEDADYINYM